MTLQDVLDKVCNGTSDNMTSKRLNISRVTFSRYRNERTIPSDEILNKFIEDANLDPVQVYMAAYAEKVHNPIVAEAFRQSRLVAA